MDSDREMNGGGEDRLNRAAAAMRETPVPLMPAGLMETTIAAARAAAGSGGAGPAVAFPALGSKKKDWWSMKTVRRTAMAAALLLAAGAGVAALTWGGGARLAFADVLEQVKAVHVLKCKVAIQVDAAGNGPTTTADMLMSDAGWTESIAGDVRVIMFPKTGKMIQLFTGKKEALVIDMKAGGTMPAQARPPAAAVPDLLGDLRKMATKDSKDLGEKEVDGRKARGFEVKEDAGTYDIWADVVTEKPVLVTIEISSALMKGVKMTMTDFDWNPVVEDGIAEGKVPEGYRTLDVGANLSAASEADVWGMLQLLGEFNGGVLPEKIGMVGLMQSLRSNPKIAGVKGTGTIEEKEALMKKIMPVARAFGFMADPNRGNDWTYAGSGVAVGEKGKPVLWYKAAAKDGVEGKWRVMDADGTVHEGAEKPPGGEKVDMDMGSMLKAAQASDEVATRPAPTLVPDTVK